MSGGGSKSKVTIPTVSYNTGGLYGSGTAGANNSFKGTDFQNNLVKTTESAIPNYLNQLINPSYDSEIFKAQTSQRNRLANQSFENNLMNPLASRNLTRGSSVNQMSNEFANNLANLETSAMANEDARVGNVLSQLFNYYQVPYNMMMGLQNNASQMAMAQMQAQASLDRANADRRGDLLSGLAGGLGSMIGNMGTGSSGSGSGKSNNGSNNQNSNSFGWDDAAKMALQLGAMYAASGSDIRLKENLELLDTVDGYNIYRFDYINGAKDQVGVIAQEILDVQPEAVGVDDSGYYFVAYGLLPEEVQQRIGELRQMIG